MVTINDIAKKAGVAKSTVSNVFTGNKHVSPELKERILKICEEIDYQPNFYASSLSRKAKTNIIGLFLEQSSTHVYRKFYSNLIESIITTLSIHNHSLLIYSGLDFSETTNKLKIGKSPIDGAIILSPTINDSRIKMFSTNLIPFILIGNPGIDANINYVDTDNVGLTTYIAKKMIKQNHKKICLINADKDLIIVKERDSGFISAFEGNSSCKYHIFYSKDSTEEDGYNYAKMAINNGYTAFITASGNIAKGVYKAANEANLNIGTDIVVFSLGFSFDEHLEFNPSLSYATQDYLSFGKIAADNLLKLINHQEVKNETISSELHIHKSFIIK